mmetsp:Transcript_122249/g.211383  ORF Transcript_122249/g.211383 Transcript_122249/m.211383 type:complete len:190 (+) Transcript_122249:65-634(+)
MAPVACPASGLVLSSRSLAIYPADEDAANFFVAEGEAADMPSRRSRQRRPHVPQSVLKKVALEMSPAGDSDLPPSDQSPRVCERTPELILEKEDVASRLPLPVSVVDDSCILVSLVEDDITSRLPLPLDLAVLIGSLVSVEEVFPCRRSRKRRAHTPRDVLESVAQQLSPVEDTVPEAARSCHSAAEPI